MTVSAVEVLRGFDADSVAYRQVKSADPEQGTEMMSIIAAGDSIPRFLAVNGSKVGIPFETGQIATVIAQCGVFGCDASEVDLYYQKVTSLSGRVADDDEEHAIVNAALARMYITNITTGHRQEASAKGKIVPVSDGTNAPLVRTGSSAISDATPSTDEAFVLGPISVNTTKLKGCNGLDVNLNPSDWDLSDESFDFTTFSANQDVKPVISFTTTDPTAETYHKTAISGSNKFRVHLIRKKANGDRFADNETQHIRFEVVSGIVLVQSVSGSPREYRVEVHAAGLDSDGFDANIITMSVNVAIVLPT
jgi:hypothetical protein